MLQLLQEVGSEELGLHSPCLVGVGGGVYGPADRSALPDTWEEAPVSKINGVEGHDCEEVTGRASDWKIGVLINGASWATKKAHR